MRYFSTRRKTGFLFANCHGVFLGLPEFAARFPALMPVRASKVAHLATLRTQSVPLLAQ
jgi:hypothetical protein